MTVQPPTAPAPALELDAYVRRLVSEAPPVTPEQLDRLTVLLRHAPRSGRAA